MSGAANMSMFNPDTPDTDRAGRLIKFFRCILSGERSIMSANDSKLFFEAARARSAPTSCMEAIIASKHGIEALQLAVRVDVSVPFIQAHTLPFIAFFSHDKLKLLADGQILQQVLVAIVKPPTFWNPLVSAVQRDDLDEAGFGVFSWLCLELLSLPSSAEIDVFPAVEAIAQTGKYIATSSPESRRLGYRIQHLLQLRESGLGRSSDGYYPGGRHDNDFEDFRSISVYPTADEFLSPEKPFYRRLQEVLEADMSERAALHLDNIYRLTREDFLGELRNDWQISRGRESGSRSALTLRNVHLVGLGLGFDEGISAKKCSLVVSCEHGLERLWSEFPKNRREWLGKNKDFLRHQAFGALFRGEEIFGFAFVDRDIARLSSENPTVTLIFPDDRALVKVLLALTTTNDTSFIIINTPAFAFEPILERLKDLKEISLQQNLLDPSQAPDDFVPSPEIQEQLERLAAAKVTSPDTVQYRLPTKIFELDQSQRDALKDALSKQTSLIVGPPGTGKSFIGALATYILTQFTTQKILVITYTNHALDQFLEDLLEIGIDSDHFVRLGSKSTQKTSSLLLSAQRSGHRRSRESWAIINKLDTEAGIRRKELHQSFETFRSSITFPDICSYLEFSAEDSMFFEAFTVHTDETGFKKVGKNRQKITQDYLYRQWKSGKGLFRNEAVQKQNDVWRIPSPLRKKLIDKWETSIRKERAERIQEHVRLYNGVQDRISEQLDERKFHTVKQKRIIGCTTTAAAMYHKLIASARPDIVLVEEAGQIQESHILTSLTASVRQLVQIGDHRQLGPKINNYNLTVAKGEGYDLDRSLFERLILQGHRHTTLRKQHRMHPDISFLVKELTYPDLQDGLGTSARQTVAGLEDRVVFVNHNHREIEVMGYQRGRDQGSQSSKENIHEAKMVLKIVKYLAQQGYKTDDMVVLTPYLGQLRRIRDELSSSFDPWLSNLDSQELVQAGLMTKAAANVGRSPLRISTIDNYQGEEANIVIASLTRSNDRGDIGFLAAPERLNVVLSRARNGLIMIGNMNTFMGSKRGIKAWTPFFELMKTKHHLYDGLPAKCGNHPDKAFLLMKPDDFEKFCPNGGCCEPCGAALKCGLHTCRRSCHRLEDHSRMACKEKVNQVCNRGHNIKILCCKSIEQCPECCEEDAEAERRIKRDLKLEANRVARRDAYKRELQEIKDEIEHQRKLIKNKKEKQMERETLAQHKADLAVLRDTTHRILNAPPKAQGEPMAPSSIQAGDPSILQSIPGIDGSFIGIPQDSRQEWEYLKRFEGAKSKPLDELMGMIGLEVVKSEFLSVKSRVDTALRQCISLEKERFSCTMLGNPGTGKTTVARLYARFLTSIGVIPGSCFKEETGASLANAGVSGVKTIIDEILNDGGGVLFIDEAYQLTSGNSHGGEAVLDYLLPEIENLSGKIVFVLAGYNKQMEAFFSHNPGLPSRFPVDLKFADYTEEELLQIFEAKMNQKYSGRMKCEDGSRGLYCRIVTRRVGRARAREGFGNARTIENTLARVSSRQAVRLRKERREKKIPDDLLFTKEDLIGPEPTEALKESKAWKKLQSLVGLEAVKDATKSLVESIRQNYLRELGEQPQIEYSLNRVFLGNPGTGKTTVAKLYGEILVDLGLLSKGEVVVKNPSDFVGAALGQSEQQTKGILAACLGKVLVIDEAYGLNDGAGSTRNPYKTAVVDTIVAEVQSIPGDDRCVLLLGYKEQMEDMFQKANPGLSRRFPISSAFSFEDFNDEDLEKILELKLKQQGYSMIGQAKRVATEVLNKARNRPNFGNAGEIDVMLDQAKARHQSRLSRNETSLVATLEAVDIDENFDRAERAEANINKLFEGTVGQEAVVALLRGYQETVRTMMSVGLEPKENIPFNFLFRGPPGTGKTTTAKKMGEVFRDMGFLSTAEVVECSATELIGQYVGQTGPKVQSLLDRALGRVLFVDEAYRLGGGNFAQEAMDELVDSVTKDRYAKKLIIILAGYKDDINRLMNVNPGLSSRFPEVVDFRGLNPDECVDLLRRELKTQQTRLVGPEAKKKIVLDISVLETPDEALGELLTTLFVNLSRQKNWASARDVKTLAKDVFNMTIKDTGGIAQGYIALQKSVVEGALRHMLEERDGRDRSTAVFSPPASAPAPAPAGPTDSADLKLPPPNVRITRAMTKAAKEPRLASPPAGHKFPNKRARTGSHTRTVESGGATRDAGVSDEVWEQLQADRRAKQQREQEYQDLLKAQRKAREEERHEIVRRLLEEEERRKEEAEASKKLQMMGACPAGYQWIKQSGGYRCAGGSHFVSDEAIMTR